MAGPLFTGPTGDAGLALAVPFYVMVIVVLFLDEPWNWWQAAGAALVATGVMLAQSVARQPG